MRNKALGGFAIAVVLLFGALLSSCDNQQSSAIRVGAVSPFTGDGANYGRAARNGIDMAVDEINSAGGIRGAKVKIIYEDDKGSPKDALSAFTKLASVDKVSAVLGPFYSGNVLAVAPEAERQHVVVITGSGTSDNIRNAGEYVFRTCPSNDEQARTIANFAYKTLGLKTSFVIYRNVDYGVTLRDAFVKAFKALGGNIAGIEAVPADASDVRTQLTKVKASGAPFVFAAVHYPEGGAMLRQAKELGIKTQFIGTDGGYDPQLLKIAGDAAEGSYWVTVGWEGDTKNPTVAKFMDAYRKRHREDPGVYSGLYYDAMHVLAVAMANASALDGPSIQRALASATFSGPTGLTKFDRFGDVDKPFAVYTVNAGKFVPAHNK